MSYVISLLPLVTIYAILVLGLNLQYGQAGILNFTYISFVAMGAYISAVLTLGPPDEGTVYVLAARVPFPLNVLAGAVAATLLGVLVSLTALRRLRSDYLAIVTLGAGLVFFTVVGNVVSLFNGFQGIDNVPLPVPERLGGTMRLLVYGLITAAFLVVILVACERIRRSPLGRVLRSVREDETVSDAFGRDVGRLKLLAFLLGSFVAGLGGGLLVTYLSAYNPAAFIPADTFLLWAAMFVGGVANNRGALLGAALVPVGFVEITRFLPNLVGLPPGLAQSLRGIAIGLLIILVPWFRPKGIVPEQLPVDDEADDEADADASAGGAADRPIRLVRVSRNAATGGPTSSDDATEAAPAAVEGRRPPAAGPAVILSVEHVSKRFGGLQAVNDCSFELHADTVTGLIGPNGAGKSTVCSMIAGERAPDSGRILFQGQPIQGLRPFEVARRGIARTFQIARPLERCTVMENLLLGPYPQRGERLISSLFPSRSVAAEQDELRSHARDVLSVFDLTRVKNEPAGNLSGGQKRLLELARAVMAQPRLLLLDEPTAGINPALIGRLLEHIRALREMGIAILIVEHNLGVIEMLCDDVVVMSTGRVLARGSLSELTKLPEVVEAYLGVTRAHGATAG